MLLELCGVEIGRSETGRARLLRQISVALGSFATRWSLVVLVIVSLVTAALAPFAKQALDNYDDDVLKFLPADAPEVVNFRQMGLRFHGLSIAVIGLEAPTGDLFSVERIRWLRTLTHALRDTNDLPGVAFASSYTELPDLITLTNENEFGVVEKIASTDLLVPEILPASDTGKEAVEFSRKIRERVLSRDLVRGSLVSQDGRATLVLVHVRPGYSESEVVSGIRRIVGQHRKKAEANNVGWEIYFGGAPFIGSYVSEVGRSDMLKLSPFVALAIVLILLLTARSLAGTIIALYSVVVGIVWFLGMMRIADRSLTLVSNSLPMLLFALGSAYSIHLLTRVLANLDAGTTDRREAVLSAVEEVGPPILIAGFTTVLGFLSFLVMDIEPMREFGWLMAVGTLVIVVLGIVVVSAGCVVLPIRPSAQSRMPDWARASLLGVARWGQKRRALVFVGLTILVAVSGWFAAQVRTRTTIRGLFTPDSEPVLAEDFLNQKLGGSIFLQVQVSGDMKDPVSLRLLERFTERIASDPRVAQIQSIAQPFLLLVEGVGDGPYIPTQRETIASVAALLKTNQNTSLLITQSGDPQSDWRHALIQIKIRGDDPQIALDLAERIERELAPEFRGVWRSVPASSLTPKQTRRRVQQLSSHLADLWPGEVVPAQLTKNLLERSFELSPKSAERALHNELKDVVLNDELIYLAEGVTVQQLFEAVLPLAPQIPGGHDVNGKLFDVVRRHVSDEELEEPEVLKKVCGQIAQRLKLALLQAKIPDHVASLWTSHAGAVEPKKLSDQERTKLARALRPLHEDVAHLPDSILNEEQRAVGDGQEIKVIVGGFPLVYAGMNRSVQRNQTLSLLVAFGLVWLVLTLFFGGAKLALLALVPAGCTVLLIFGIMGFAGFSMDVGTSMIASIALGVGIDYAVHFMWRYGAVDPNGAQDRLEATIDDTAWGIIINALEIAAGFGLLALGSIVPMQNLGILSSLAMIISAGATLFLLPALLGAPASQINSPEHQREHT